MSAAIRCPRYRCTEVARVVAIGGTTRIVCTACERNQRGLCRDCPRRLENARALRCRGCATLRRIRYDRRRASERHAERRPEDIVRQTAYRTANREKAREYLRQWRTRNPRDDRDRLYNRLNMRRLRSA